MTRKRKKEKPSAKPAPDPIRAERPAQSARRPVDVYEGIPDCAARRSRWRWVVMVMVFVGWLVFLGYCWLAGSPDQP
ncbi:MAG: hypothetical protein ACYS8X_06550 [Planctomycetota bacterium]|jgi:hypothetical protein